MQHSDVTDCQTSIGVVFREGQQFIDGLLLDFVAPEESKPESVMGDGEMVDDDDGSLIGFGAEVDAGAPLRGFLEGADFLDPGGWG